VNPVAHRHSKALSGMSLDRIPVRSEPRWAELAASVTHPTEPSQKTEVRKRPFQESLSNEHTRNLLLSPTPTSAP